MMGVQYVWAREGKEFAPTKAGETIGRISYKFKDTFCQSDQYKRCVPKRWVSEGYVIEVDKGKKSEV